MSEKLKCGQCPAVKALPGEYLAEFRQCGVAGFIVDAGEECSLDLAATQAVVEARLARGERVEE